MFLTVFVAGGWRLSPVVQEKKKELEDFVHKLPLEEVAISETAWSAVLFDLEKSQEIAEFLKEKSARAGDLLAAGAHWSGAGWNTSRASHALQSLTRVPRVSSDLNNYKNTNL